MLLEGRMVWIPWGGSVTNGELAFRAGTTENLSSLDTILSKQSMVYKFKLQICIRLQGNQSFLDMSLLRSTISNSSTVSYRTSKM